MRPYLLVTSIVFGLVTVAHIWRMVGESAALAKDPWFLALTVVAAGLSIWSAVLFRRARHRAESNP
ncbi:MAG TPA: hypothetical protein VL383_16220 [Gemmatimonadaceae bacterium]|jgi:hypothetical protein|nr:hypothetical protein [Gemmatimonadaceae bacterium]